VSVIIESIKLTYEAIVNLFERVEAIEQRAKLLPTGQNPPVIERPLPSASVGPVAIGVADGAPESVSPGFGRDS
jgi:hypothetical protein